ncbi:hypothetical protein LTR85_006200 [Meristemomyces frigidus]|nr:hypothetical protein LTR85_006200 [Meristemomyces frigidus]
MADRASDGPPYGQFGQALYDPDERVWHFERTPNAGHALKPVGEPRLVYGTGELGDSEGKHDLSTGPPSQRHAQQVRDLIKVHPELQPASRPLPPLLRVSEAVVSATALHDPLKGSLLDVGRVPSEATHSTIDVAAFASGPTGSDLRLAQTRTQRRGWDKNRAAWIQVPAFHGEAAVWRGEGAPIQQIRFAHALERSDAVLAVRLITRTLIFRPTLGKTHVDASSCLNLDPNPVFEMPVRDGDGLPHADVAFNPWYIRQCGVVDQAGRWSVWELDGRATNTGKCVCEGRVPVDLDCHAAVADGWARIMWVCNPSTVAVSTRHRLALLTVTEGTSPSTAITVFSTEGGPAWILDVVALLTHPSYLFVLTSERIVLYKINTDGADALSVKSAFSMKHYRSPQDITLSLTLCEDNGEIVILLRSSVNPVAVNFRLRIEEDDRIFGFDPSDLALPDGLLGLHLASAPYGNNQRRDADHGVATRYRACGIRFQNLLYIGKDLDVLQQLYAVSPPAQNGREVVPPTWDAALPAKSGTKVREESFVIDDDHEEAVEAEPMRERPSSSFVRRRAVQATRRRGVEWTLSIELTAQEIESAGHWDTQGIDQILKAAEGTMLQQDTEMAMPLRTLLELATRELTVGDIEGASLRLQNLGVVEPHVKAEHADDGEVPTESGAPLTVRRVTGATRPDLQQRDAGVTMAIIYDGMVDDFVSPLAPDIPGRTRLAKEQLVRRAAAEVALASRVIRLQDAEQQPPLDSQPFEQQTWELPVRGGVPSSMQFLPSSSQQPLSSSQLQSQQSALPTPSPSATPSLTTGSSLFSTLTAPPIARLSRFTAFAKPGPSALPRSLSNVLSHWEPGADPATYDWLSTSRRIARRAEDEMDSQTMTEKERARAQRKAEKHIRRQRREAAASQAAQLASSQAPEIAISASQPQHLPMKVESQPVGVAGSSQSQGLGGMPSASQVVPGRFGGRPPKKKRKQGF